MLKVLLSNHASNSNYSKNGNTEREREREVIKLVTDLRSDGGVELRGEEVVMEVIEGEVVPRELGDVVALMQHLLHHLLRVSEGHVILALNLRQEAAEVVGGHVGPALGVLLEELLHLRRRHRLRHLEPPLEAHAHSVAPHVSEIDEFWVCVLREWCNNSNNDDGCCLVFIGKVGRKGM